MPVDKKTVIPLAELQGVFVVKEYQRGYRWTEEQVLNLLQDFLAFASRKNGKTDDIYFLQPIVVSRLDIPGEKPHWELIDGQQRLTTIYLIDAVLRNILETKSDLSFEMVYKSRPGSEIFLKELAANPKNTDLPAANENMDYYHMLQACRVIHAYFTEKNKQGGLIRRLYQEFTGNVHVLWYDTTDEEGSNPIERFSRLNMGRIPLTGAELSRALLLNIANHDLTEETQPPSGVTGELAGYLKGQLASKVKDRRQIVLGSRWDDVERELRDPDFWAFLGGKVSDTRATRIDFLLDLYTDKPCEETRKNFAFDELSARLAPSSREITGEDAQKVWDDITRSYQMLRFWYEDHDYYHWIGYLNDREGSDTIRKVLQLAKTVKKSELKKTIFALIRRSISKNEALPDLENLQYKKNDEPIHNLLFLFNVEYARRVGSVPGCRQARRFPFGEHRAKSWSLEHIQAQNVERLQKADDWTAWVRDHQKALREIHGETLPQVVDGSIESSAFDQMKEQLDARCQKFIDRPKKEAAEEEFRKLSKDILEFIEDPRRDAARRMHAIFNLALLDIKSNSMLSNSIFAVKRMLLRDMIKSGKYIPIATEAVFMRYFSAGDQTLPYWSADDQAGYDRELREVLATFEWDPEVEEETA